ncbi:hypothetical protein Y032_0021g259 [Ancylostoma ceylanicum]|uniref:Uncharacterized protein n=1 Tax=Ancylostoma ceylanicum TaxID=53326 RepID=A0A016UYP0_9BILA|nr:hypothetical protein Y032_0021g259 [Ancylostoma ceylanicum]
MQNILKDFDSHGCRYCSSTCIVLRVLSKISQCLGYSSRFLSSFRLMPVQRGIRRQVDIAYIYFMADGSVAVLFPNHDFYRSIPRELTESVAFFPVFITRFY